MHQNYELEDKIRTLQKWIDESKRIVFFGGAGVSTESGIPDFRSPDGIYSKKVMSNEHITTEICSLDMIF